MSAPIRAQEQDQTLYLIASAPLTRFTESFPVFLYELSGSELSEVKTLTEQVDAALFVRPYHRYDLVLVGSEPVNGTLRLTVTDINNVEKQVTHEVELCETCTLAFSHLLEMPDNQLVYAFVISELVQGTAVLHVLGVLLENGAQFALELSDLKHAVNFGSPGGNVDGGDELRSIYSVGKDAVFGYAQQLPLDWTLPEELTLAREDTIFQLVNNRELRAITALPLITSEGGGRTTLCVQDKRTQEWSSVTVNGNLLRVRGFGEWIVAEEAYRENEPNNVSYDSSPGIFLDAEARFAYSQMSQTGRLYLYNVLSNTYIEYMTGNPDSEVLLIDDRDIYIRAGDELIKGLIEGDQIIDQQVVLKGSEMLDFHWLLLPGN